MSQATCRLSLLVSVVVKDTIKVTSQHLVLNPLKVGANITGKCYITAAATRFILHMGICFADKAEATPRTHYLNLKHRGSASPLILIKYAFLRLPRSATSAPSGTAAPALGPATPDWTHNMDSGSSSLGTTLSWRSASSFPEDDAKHVHEPSDATEPTGDEHKWKNRFEGVFQNKPPGRQVSSLSDRESDSSEATTCRYLDTSSSLSSHALEANAASGGRLGSGGGDVCTSGEQGDEWRRSGWQREEPAAPAEREEAALRLNSLWQQSAYGNTWKEEDDDSCFTGVFQAKLVELDGDPAATPTTPPASPDPDWLSQFEMDNLVDTLKSMGPAMRPRSTASRSPAPAPISSLPPIVEDTPSPASLDVPDFSAAAAARESLERKPGEQLNGLYTLPLDLGLRNTRDTRSLLDLMKQNQQVEKRLQLSSSLVIFQ